MTGPVETARRFLEAWRQRDLEAMLSACHLSEQSPWAQRLFARDFGPAETFDFTYLETPVNLGGQAVTSWEIQTGDANERIHISSVRVFQNTASEEIAGRFDWAVNPTGIVRDAVGKP